MAAKKTPIRRHLKNVTKTTRRSSLPKTVKALKKKYQELPLHFLFGIEKEIEHQCPALDDYLDELDKVKEQLYKIIRVLT